MLPPVPQQTLSTVTICFFSEGDIMRAWLILQPGLLQVRKVSAFLALLITCHGLSVAQQKKTTCLSEVKYENHNFLEPEALIVSDLKGQVADELSDSLSRACLSVFTEAEHKLVASTTSDEDGYYKFDKIPPGQYRFVVFVYGFCTANARITITDADPRSLKYRSVYVHMRIRKVDTCSFANHTRPRIENGR
jgi:Carboxypeptidase regulatory-like domain